MPSYSTTISCAVEGQLDEFIVTRIVNELGLELGNVYVKSGKRALKKSIHGFNYAANHGLWFVLVDLDGAGCAPSLVSEWLGDPAPGMCLRVAVNEAEAWLLADKMNIARFLGVSSALIPNDPDSITDPKQVLVNIAARSRSRDIRSKLIPPDDSTAVVGPAYMSTLGQFVRDHWDVQQAAANSRSLQRCLNALSSLVRRIA